MLLALLVACLGTVGVVVGANDDLRKGFLDLFRGKGQELIPYVVKRQRLVITVNSRGALESSKNEEVKCKVEGQTTILSILPEGTRVEKGELVAELDSATLTDNRVNQEIATERAKADLESSMRTREVAEISVNEYTEGTYPKELKDIEAERTVALSELERARDRLQWSEKMFKNDYIAEGQVIADRLTLQKSQIAVEQADRKKYVLETYTAPKQITDLQASVEKAKADELAKQQTFKLEVDKLEKLKKQINETKLFAPNAGLIVYANEQEGFRGNNEPLIMEGATVRERQTIFSLPDIEHMQVNVKVHESEVNRVRKGLEAKARVDAFPNAKLTGTVQSVQPLPDPSSFFSSDIKVYTTIVTLDQSYSALRPGMNAEVEILINVIEDALCIPVTAILPLKGKDYVYKITPTGPVRTEVQLGDTNDTLIEVKEGLAEGDKVAMSPAALLTDAEKEEAFSASARASSRAADFADSKAPSPGESTGEDAKAKQKKAGGNPMALFQKLRQKSASLTEDEQAQLKDFELPASETEALLKKAGMTDEESAQIIKMREQAKQGGFGGGGGGFGGGGRPGGGGGRPGGGGPQ